MGAPSYDFSGRHVLVTGGARGVGLMVARAFLDSGAEVTVTGTASLLASYDSDLSGLAYEQLDLTDGDQIAELAARLGHVDVLVNAAAPRLASGVDPVERDFVAQAARLALLGPFQLATRLRHRMATSPTRGGGSVVNLPATRRWFEIAPHDTSPDVALEEVTRRVGTSWARLGVRLNTVTAPLDVPTQQPRVRVQIDTGSGPLLTRTALPRTTVQRELIDVSLFLASSGAAGLSGQTLRLGLEPDGLPGRP